MPTQEPAIEPNTAPKGKPSKVPEGTPITAIIVGAGARGHGYPSYACYYPKKFKIVGVCEPREYQRNIQVEIHKIPADKVFLDWKEAAELDRFADAVLICTPDRLHKDPAIAFAKKGYHLFLEKPMSNVEADCREIVATCKAHDTILAVCHILRYTPWVNKVKEIIDSGAIGKVVNICHTEPIGFWHFAHSFVRGNWHKEADSSFSLLAKCCHDVDLICYWIEGHPCTRVSSFGNLSHFHEGDKPPGAADRCLDCPASVENSCPYSAKKIYLEPVQKGTGHRWPISVITDVVDIENVTQALKTGPYGRCVYSMDNDVVSHQVVNMQFAGGATATLQMVAFTEKVCAREVKVYGTKGQITVVDGHIPLVTVYDFLKKENTRYEIEDEAPPGPLSGHGGADFYAIAAFVDTLLDPDKTKIVTGADDTLASHLLTFAAERARKENRVLNLNDNNEYV